MGSANLYRCRRLFKIGVGDPAADADLARLDASMTRQLTAKIGRAWFDGQGATTRMLDVDAGYCTWLRLPAPIRVLGPVETTAGAVEGVTLDFWTATVAPDGVREYTSLNTRPPIAYPMVGVTAQWADALPTPIPDDIVEAVTILVVGFHQRDENGIVGSGEVEIGIDGQGGQVRDPWGDPRVRATVKTWTLPVPLWM